MQAPQGFQPPPPMPGAPAPQMPTQQVAHTPQPLTRAPQTISDPGNTGAVPGGMPTLAEVNNHVLGMARTQNMMFILLLELAQNHLGLSKQDLANLAVKNSLAGEPESFFEGMANQGKAG